MRRPRVILALIMAGLALLSYYGIREFNPITGETQHIGLTKDQEIAIGLQSAPAMAEQFGGLDEDPALQALVAEVGSHVASHSIAGETGYDFQFHLLRDPQTVNAFALPGGPIFVTRGLLQRLENEAQLAGVLGHEIGHVIGRHSSEQIAKSQLAQSLVTAVGVAASDQGGSGQGAAQMAAMVAQMVQMKYGRGHELQSDQLGVRSMAQSGYDPRALTRVMEILAEASGGSRQPEFMSSHPDPGNRVQLIEAEIAKLYPNGVPAELTLGRPVQL
jgi:predicted Zn-dependent protease